MCIQWAKMMKAYTILMALCMVVLFSCNDVEGGAYMRHEALSRKGLKEQIKLATSGLNPSVSNLSGHASRNINGVNNNSKSTNTNMSDTATAYTRRLPLPQIPTMTSQLISTEGSPTTMRISRDEGFICQGTQYQPCIRIYGWNHLSSLQI